MLNTERPVIASLAADYPVLYLNPDTDSIETYRRVVLNGEDPGSRTLAHYRGDEFDREETMETPAGTVRTVRLGNRQDFELVIRGFMAAKEGPLAAVPESQGAAMLTVFNWPRIHRHLSAFPKAERDDEFRRFTADKKNYVDMLVVLSRGPYSHVSADAAGYPEEKWLELSDTIRLFHELTHVVCRRLYPGNIDAVRDELIADAVGLFAAFGRFDPALEKQFLGIRDGRYTGGRLGNYTERPEELAEHVCGTLERITEMAGRGEWADPFELIPAMMALFSKKETEKMNNKEMEKLNTEELDQVAGGNFIEDAIDAAGKAVNAVGDAIGYVKRQVDLYDADLINSSKLQKAAEKNGIEKPTSETPTRSGRVV